MIKNWLKQAIDLIKAHRRAYIIINVIYYGLVAVMMIYAAFNQELQNTMLEEVGASFMTGPLAAVGDAYINTKVLLAILLTFVVNLFIGALATITLPSLIIPAVGVLIGFYRAVLWGLILSPAHPSLRYIMIPHSITLLLEGQAYILAMFAAYIHARNFLSPHTAGEETRSRGYLAGLKNTGRLYVLATLTLAVAAIYEVLEVAIIIWFFSG